MTFGKRIAVGAVSVFFSLAAFSVRISADEPYTGYNYDWWEDPVPSQNGYSVERVADGRDLDLGRFADPAGTDTLTGNPGGLNKPSDIFIDRESGTIYIADTGNNRIVVTDETFSPDSVRIIDGLHYGGEFPENRSTVKKTGFVAPGGVFVRKNSSGDNIIYVADSGNNRIVAFSDECEIVMEYVRPSDEVFGADKSFAPEKVTVDSSYSVYAVVPSVTQGAMRFSSDGTFSGYFGANRVTATADVIAEQFWKLIYTREQITAMRRSVAMTISNLDTDDKGFIYTVTGDKSSDTDVLKKLNSAGTNVLIGLGYADRIYGDAGTVYYKGTSYSSIISDVDVDEEGNIYLLDKASGRIFEYSDECDLLFIFGTKGFRDSRGNQKGTFRSPAAVETYKGRVYVVDSLKNSVTVFRRTEFGEIVHKAIRLFNEGYYEEAREPWEEVLRRDANYRLAYIGLGNACLSANDYESAMKYFYRNSRQGYDRAFKSHRLEVIRANFNIFLIIVLIVVIALIVFMCVRRTIKRGKTNKSRKEDDEHEI